MFKSLAKIWTGMLKIKEGTKLRLYKIATVVLFAQSRLYMRQDYKYFWRRSYKIDCHTEEE